jgi:hypothetical protein
MVVKKSRKLRHFSKRTRRVQRGGENIEGFTFVKLLDSSAELRNEITEHQRQCWPESDEIKSFYEFDIEKTNKKDRFLIYKKDEGAIVFSRLLTLLPDEKAISIDLTCVSASHRGKGYYKSSLAAMRSKFDPDIYKYLINKAEYETIGDITHTKRLEVFHKLGYRLSPLTTIGADSSVPTQLKLKSGEIVYVLDFIEGTPDASYSVLGRTMKPKTIKVLEIDRCVMPKTELLSVVVDDGSVDGKLLERKSGEKWEFKDEGLSVDGVVYQWNKLSKYKREIIEGNRFNVEKSEEIHCPLIMPF